MQKKKKLSVAVLLDSNPKNILSLKNKLSGQIYFGRHDTKSLTKHTSFPEKKEQNRPSEGSLHFLHISSHPAVWIIS